MQRHRIVLAGGYTAGHIHPLIAVAREFALRDREIVVLGNGAGPEAEIVPSFGFTFRKIASAPLRGVRSNTHRAHALGLAASAFWDARRLLSDASISFVAGFGGYVSAAPILAARSLGIPTAIFEANAVPGLANRYLHRIADVSFAGLAMTTERPGWSDAIVSGHPILGEVLLVARPEGRQASPLRILVTAGLRGSTFLNTAVPELAAGVQRRGVPVAIHHQSGYAPDEVARAYARLGVNAHVDGFIGNMAAALERCDVVICAGGAGTLSELAALGIPTLIVPIANTADDHQTANARAFGVRSGTAFVSERDFDVVRTADLLLRLTRTNAGAGSASRNAAAIIADHCEALMAARRPVVRRYASIEHASR